MKAFRAVLGMAYPFAVFAGLQLGSARAVSLGILAIFALRALASSRRVSIEQARRIAAPGVAVGAVLLAGAVLDDRRAVLFLPVGINLALLLAFGRTLVHGPPLVETFARVQVPDLPDDEVRYCRSVTWVWCAFFLVNGSIAAALALYASIWAWTLYNGLLAYLAMGVLFAGEFVVRSWRFGRYEGSLVEPLFRRWFRPPPVASEGLERESQ